MRSAAGRVLRPLALLGLCAGAGLTSGTFADPPDDGIALAVLYGSAPGQIALQWTGGQPTFAVYRSDRPDNVVDPGHKLGETNEVSWVDDPPAGSAWFYLVTGGLDRVPPAITAIGAPPPNANGWNSTDVTVTFDCADAGSGIATCPAPVVVGVEGAGQTISGTATDNAGNMATATITLNIDKTPPTLTITAPTGTFIGGPSPDVRLQYTDGVAGADAASLLVRVDGNPLAGCSALQTAAICPTPPLAPGNHPVEASIADRAGNARTESLQFNLVVNGAPTLAPIGSKTAALGSTLSFVVAGSDPDGNPTTFDASPLPLLAHASFDRATGTFTYKPSADQVGSHVITFSISDGVQSDSEAVTVTVPPANPGAPGTLHGRVLDANSFMNNSEVPIVNATISLMGTFRSALSDAQGNFTITNVPGGDQLLDIAAGTAQPAPDGSLYGGFREAIHLIGGVDNVVERPFFLPRINEASRTTVNPVQTTVITNPSLGATLVVPPHTAKNPDGSDFTGQLSISLVPRGLAPAQLPANLDPGLLITIQPVGVVFGSPVALTLGNIDNVPANNDMNLWSLLASEGRFAVVGRGTVSADGQKIETVTGGVRAADWHMFLPPETSPANPTDDTCDPSVCCCGAAMNSSATFREGALLEDFTLPSVRSLGVSRTLRLAYRSTTADLRPIISLDALLSVRAAVPQTFSASVQVGGVTQGAALFYETTTLPENDDSTSRLALQVDASGLSTGIYPFETRVSSHYSSSSVAATSGGTLRVVNSRQSPIGAGWGIAGLQRIHVQSDGALMFTDGDGSSTIFKPVSVGRFTDLASMHLRRGDGPGLAPLPDGRILVVGGTTTTTFDFSSWTRTTEIYDPVSDTWTFSGLTNGLRGLYMPVLHDGRILAAGSGTAETYDPSTGVWTPTGSMVNTFNSNTITLLGNGRVLVTGGQGFSAAELFDPVTNTWRPALGGMSQVRSSHDATLMQDGRVLISGGEAFCGATPVASAEIYDPNTERFTPTGSMLTPRASHRGTLLPDGRVLISGGAMQNSCSIAGLLDSLEVFDPSSGTFTAVAGRLCAPKERHFAIALADGRVLIAGGYTLGPAGTSTACADIFDSVTNGVTTISPMHSARGAIFALRLADGRVMTAGGCTGAGQPTLNTAEMFQVVAAAGQYQSPPGDFSTLVQNADGTFTRTYKDGTRVQFNAAGLQTSVIDRNNNTTSYAYDAAGRLRTMTDPADQVWTLDYAGNGRLQSVTDPAARVTQFAHDAEGNLVQITKADGNTIGYSYDAYHRMTREIDERGKLSLHVFDGLGRLASVAFPTGETRVLLSGQVQGAIDPAGGLGTPTSPAPITRAQDVQVISSDGNGHASRIGLNTFGAPTVQTDALGRATTTTRNGFNLPTQVIRPNGSVVTMTYDGRGNLLTSTEESDPNGPATTTYTYESTFNHVTSVKDSLDHTTTVVHDTRGNATTVRDARGKETVLTYDTRGLLTSIHDPTGNTTSFTHDAQGNVETITDPREKVTILGHDAAGNVTSSRDPLGRVTQTAYDSLNRVTSVIDPLNGLTVYSYDPSGNLISLNDAGHHATAFVYDDRSLLIETRNQLGQSRRFFYDPARNLDHVIDAKGQRVDFTYNEADELTRKVLKDSSGLETDIVNYGYDLLGNLATASDGDSGLSFTYDPVGGLSTASTTAGPAQPATTISYLYDKAGNRKRMTDPHGNQTTYVYDSVDRLTTLTSIDGTFTFGYDDASRRTSLQFPNTTKATYDYDAASQLTALHYLNSAQALLSKFDYTYDDKGNRDSRTNLDGVTSYTYDPLDRLIRAVGPDPANPAQEATESYAYDSVGNRIASHLVTSQVLDAANRLLEDSRFAYEYDANGNLTSKLDKATSDITTYEWDPEDRLVVVHKPTQMVTLRYDPLGRRIEKAAGATVRYVYDEEDIIEDLNETNGLISRYTHGPGIDEPLARRDPSGQTLYYQVDGIGTITDTTNASGQVTTVYRYDSFGNIFLGDDAGGHAFAGREWDPEDRLYFLRARHYDSFTGRFMSEDPVGFRFSDANLYAYAHGNPINRRDAFGLADDSVSRSLEAAIRSGRSDEIRAILDEAGETLSSEAREAANAAIKRLGTRAQDIISQECRGSINRVFPDELRNKTLEQIYRLAERGDKVARTARKLLTSTEYLK